MDTEELKGRAVVSLLQAQKLGVIEEVLLDLKGQCLAGLALHGGLFRGGPLVSWPAVRTIGQDAVMVDDSAAATAGAERASDGTRVSDLRGLKVVSDAGELVGTLDGVDVDPESGALNHFFVQPIDAQGSHGGPRFLVPPKAVAAIGHDLVTIDARVIEAQRQTPIQTKE